MLFYRKTQYVPTLSFKGMKNTSSSGLTLAMVGYDFWTPNSVNMHIWIADPRGFTRKFIRECFNYVFLTCNRGLVMGVIPSDNGPSLEVARRIGFKIVHTVKDGWSEGIDIFIHELRQEDCRWLRRH